MTLEQFDAFVEEARNFYRFTDKAEVEIHHISTKRYITISEVVDGYKITVTKGESVK